MTTSPAPRPIAALDVPLPELEAYLAAFSFWTAARRTKDPSEQVAFALDAWLVTHPQAPVSTDADYDGWAEHIAALQTANRRAKEAS
jgi:hypothetical protein